jgi:hypothetical protein
LNQRLNDPENNEALNKQLKSFIVVAYIKDAPLEAAMGDEFVSTRGGQN